MAVCLGYKKNKRLKLLYSCGECNIKYYLLFTHIGYYDWVGKKLPTMRV